MNPPLSSEGTTATHSADASTSSGIPLSGAAWISSSTVAAPSTRPEALDLVSSSEPAERIGVRRQTSSSRTRGFRMMPHLGDGILLSYLVAMILFDAGLG